MAIDWSTEPFAPLFKRITDEDRLLTWHARAIWREFLQRCDSEGFIEARRGVRGFAAVLEIPFDVVEGALPELLEDGRIRSLPDRGFVAPNYVAALSGAFIQGARVQDRIRKKGKRQDPSGTRPGSVQDKAQSADHRSEDLGSGSLFSSDPLKLSSGEIVTTSRRRRIPDTWTPRAQERAKARELGLNCDDEAAEFLSYWIGDGRVKADWDRTFLNRLYQQAKRKRPGNRSVFDVVDSVDLGDR